MQALGVIASPRTDGNTARVVAETLRGFVAAGGVAQTVFLAAHNVRPCRGCFTCERTGACPVQDGFPAIIESMQRADLLVIGTPVYFGHVSGHLKTFIDRCRCLISFREALPECSADFAATLMSARKRLGRSPSPISRLRRGKLGVIVLAYYQEGATRFRHVSDWLAGVLDVLGVRTAATIPVDSVLSEGDVASRPEILEIAYTTGLRLAREIGRR